MWKGVCQTASEDRLLSVPVSGLRGVEGSKDARKDFAIMCKEGLAMTFSYTFHSLLLYWMYYI